MAGCSVGGGAFVKFEPIQPKRPILNSTVVGQQVEARMKTLMADLQRRAMEYEAPPSPSYIRTNTLKKSWSRKVKWQGQTLLGEVYSSGNVAPYNVFVRGPKIGPPGLVQARVMGRRGWRSVTEIWAEYWPKASADFRRIIRGAGK